MYSAVDEVKDGKAWAAIVIPSNFSRDMMQRIHFIIDQKRVPSDIINGSTIEVYEDVTSTKNTEMNH